MKRLVEETACLHRYFGDCTFKTDDGDPCPGGSSREVTVDRDSLALVGVAAWKADVVRMFDQAEEYDDPDWMNYRMRRVADALLDALAGGL